MIKEHIASLNDRNNRNKCNITFALSSRCARSSFSDEVYASKETMQNNRGRAATHKRTLYVRNSQGIRYKMGTYHELLLKTTVKDIDSDTTAIFNFLFNADKNIPSKLPDHPIFSGEKSCSMIHSMSSHIPWSESRYKDGYLFVRCDTKLTVLKDGKDKIELILDYLWPFIDAQAGECIGWRWHEELDIPDIIIYDGDSKVKYKIACGKDIAKLAK